MKNVSKSQLPETQKVVMMSKKIASLFFLFFRINFSLQKWHLEIWTSSTKEKNNFIRKQNFCNKVVRNYVFLSS